MRRSSGRRRLRLLRKSRCAAGAGHKDLCSRLVTLRKNDKMGRNNARLLYLLPCKISSAYCHPNLLGSQMGREFWKHKHKFTSHSSEQNREGQEVFPCTPVKEQRRNGLQGHTHHSLYILPVGRGHMCCRVHEPHGLGSSLGWGHILMRFLSEVLCDASRLPVTQPPFLPSAGPQNTGLNLRKNQL